MASAWEVGSANASSEEGIAGKKEKLVLEVEGNGVGRMTGDVGNFKGEIAQCEGGFSFEKVIDGEVGDIDRDSPGFAGLLVANESSVEFGIAVDFRSGFSESRGIFNVIEMLMG